MEELIAEIIGTIIGTIIVFIIRLPIFLYEYFYYKSNNFLKIKDSIKKFTDDCNELNQHIEELKNSYINSKLVDFGQGDLIDDSNYKFKRPELKKMKDSPNIYNCSLTVLRNAQQQPFKYLCKYFNIKENEETLTNFEKVLNDFSAAEQGKNLLRNERDKIVKGVSSQIPFIIKTIRKKTLIRKLGFEDIDFSQLYFPRFSFRYISGGGNSSMRFDIVFNIDTLNRFINYLSNVVKFKKSVAGQRALMTSNLREKIKKRDNYTCKHCGLSTTKEPNLLLEIDHIIPLSKNGMTTEDNLQTLCWRCNRSKGAKIEFKK